MAGWHCPFCGQIATSSAIETVSSGYHTLKDTKYGHVSLSSFLVLCPNDNCKEVVVVASLEEVEISSHRWESVQKIEEWRLRPTASVKTFPDFIPKAILDDYKEAAQIRVLSPKASATLSRRCLQGMIRDFWEIKPGRLVDEINNIRDKVDPSTWAAIDAIRSIGNIGAHMEKDINLIVDVEPEEAELLIKLIETLINDWYVVRENRKKMTDDIVALAAEKQAARKSNT